MISCPNCKKNISIDWDFCNYCGEELFFETGHEFSYNQLFELMKLEIDRTSQLDTKAGTYSGLLGVAVAILTGFGSILTTQRNQINELKNTLGLTPKVSVIIFILYVLIFIMFASGVFFAFKAYNFGDRSKNSADGSPKIIEDLQKRECYASFDWTFFPKFCNQKTISIQKALIPYLDNLIYNNYYVNNEKAKGIGMAHRATLYGISLLILTTIIIFLNSLRPMWE